MEQAFGKLHDVAETLFCVAYGLNGFPKIQHAIAIPFWMSHYNCSFRAITALLYGNTYNDILGKWRACVKNYDKNLNLSTISLDNLPVFSKFDAHSRLQYKTTLDQRSRGSDSNVAMRAALREMKFSFQTPVNFESPQASTPTVFQLSSLFMSLTFHQRVALALNVASCLHQILTCGNFQDSGRFIMSSNRRKRMFGQPIMLPGTNDSPCASIIGISSNPILIPAKTVTQYLYPRLHQLSTLSMNAHLLEPFLHATRDLSKKQFLCGKTRLVAHNLTPPNIFVAFEGLFFFSVLNQAKKKRNKNVLCTGEYPVVAQITGWDLAEVLPSEIAHCSVPGWLWGDVKPSPDGSLLDKPCTSTWNNIVRISFIDKMEQLMPGYFQTVTSSQALHLGLLGRIASNGLNLANAADRAFYDDAFAALSK